MFRLLVTNNLTKMSVTYINTTPKTPVYHRPAKTAKPSKDILILIPGNPGLVDFYITYLDVIHAQFPHFEILCIGHAGFLKSGARNVTYDLAFQIEHKYEIVKQLVLSKNERKIVPNLYFLHHSMGSFVYQRALQKMYADKTLHGAFNVRFSGFITPTITDIAASPNGQKLTTLMRWNVPVVQIAVLLSFVLGLLPDFVLRALIKYHLITRKVGDTAIDSSSYENSIEGVYKLLQSETIINQALTMAQEEMRHIALDIDVNDWYFKNSDKLGIKNWMFFAKNDHWVHDETRDFLIDRYHDDKVTVCEVCKDTENPITHSFCVTQSEQFAGITIDRIKKICELDLD
ncbi:hypothetical protein Cantr_09084 [Candida viswanathii]|uniref:Lipid droplet-associated hydrolase n=1 Tax=Candida viswanathii TaxID=5486 RepID=A0A367Y9Q7_9ASCO|nr:hypothetical protein Cantr_09084 [Candida viswanathii]